MTHVTDLRKCFIAILLIAGCLAMTGTDLFAKTITYEGCVIDADTLEPLEGALVVAIWKESRGGGMLYKERFKSAQECLTDKHGRWTLSGPVEARGVARLTSYLTLYRTMEPRFYVYCKGYVERGWATYRFNGFSARPFHDEKTGIAGILLIKPGDTEEEKRTYREKYTSAFTVPLVPTDNPQERLEHLDFNFEYAPDTRMIGSSFSSRESYVVYGLKKGTRSSSKFGGYPDLPFSAKAQVPILYQRKHPRHQGLLVPPQVTSGKVIEVQRSDAGGLK